MAVFALSVVMPWVAYPAEKLIKALKRKANVGNNRSGEQDLHLEAMAESGLRIRPGHGQISGNASSPTSTEGTLTPSSNDGCSQTEDSYLRKKWSQVSGRFGPKATTEMTEEEKKEFDIRGYNNIVHEKINDHTPGFGRIAAFTASDPSFGICRGFKWGYHFQITQLGVEVDVLDRKIRESEKKIYANDEFDPRLLTTPHPHPDPSKKLNTEHWDLVKEHRLKLKEYGDMVQSHMQMQALPKASKRSYFAVFDWIWGEQELAPGYIDYFHSIDDFVSLSNDKVSSFEDTIMDYICNPPMTRFKKFVRSWYVTKDAAKKTEESPDRVSFYDTNRLRKTDRARLACIVISILLIPIYLLFLIPMSRPLMALTATIFIIPFTFVVSATGARDFEVLIAIPTFGAVLIMFLGNAVQEGGH